MAVVSLGSDDWVVVEADAVDSGTSFNADEVVSLLGVDGSAARLVGDVLPHAPSTNVAIASTAVLATEPAQRATRDLR